jgi:hypothetical protein
VEYKLEYNLLNKLEIIWNLSDDEVCERTARTIISKDDIVFMLEDEA